MSPDDVQAIMAESAEKHGRTVEEEWGLAAEAWVHSAVLASLLMPETQEHLGDLVPAYRERAVSELQALYARAFPGRTFPENVYRAFWPTNLN
jgi:hypothetical protein